MDMESVMNAQLIINLQNDGYSELQYIQGKGICGIQRFIFTTGLVYNIDEIGYKGRYCFEKHAEAIKALSDWSKNPELPHPPGNWLKHKGANEFSNPDYIKE